MMFCMFCNLFGFVHAWRKYMQRSLVYVGSSSLCSHTTNRCVSWIMEGHFAFAETVGLQSAIIFVIVFLLGFYWIRLPRNLPPGPSGWPAIGSSLALSRAPTHVVFTEWSKQYGEVFSVCFGSKLFVVLNGLHSIKQALQKQGDVFSERIPSNIINKIYGVKGSFAVENGAIWKERRRFGLGALRSFGMGKKSIEHSINEESRYLLDCFADQEGKPFDPTHLANNAVSNIICKICFGYRFNYSDPKFAELLTLVREHFSTGTLSLANFVGWLIYTPLYSSLRENFRRINGFIRGIIQEHRECYDENDIRDIIDMHFADVVRRESSGKVDDPFQKDEFSDEALGRGIFDLFVAGTDTTTATLLWLMMYMALNPDMQRKVQAEIDNVIGDSRQPSKADSQNMPYTNAAILEIFRIRPVGPLALPHYTKEETMFNGYKLPRHTCVIVNIWALHHDPATWTEPEKYNPARFLSADGKSVVHNEWLNPFGIGRRACLGESLARSEMFIFFINILQQFTVSFPEGKPIPSQDGFSGLVLSPGPYELCATRRS